MSPSWAIRITVLAGIFSFRELLLPAVYKPGNLVLWGPQLYFVIFGNRLRLIALLSPPFANPVGHCYTKHSAALDLLTFINLEAVMVTERKIKPTWTEHCFYSAAHQSNAIIWKNRHHKSLYFPDKLFMKLDFYLIQPSIFNIFQHTFP